MMHSINALLFLLVVTRRKAAIRRNSETNRKP